MSTCSSGTNHQGEESCSSGDGGVTHPPKDPAPPKNFKAKGPAILGRRGLPTDRAEFEKTFPEKFRAALLYTAVVEKGDNVLLAFSGGPSSRALLHLLITHVDSKSAKKQYLNLSIIHVDAGAALNLSLEQRKQMLAEVASICSEYPKYQLYIANVENLFGEEPYQVNPYSAAELQINEANIKKCEEYMASFKAPSAKEDALRQLIQQSLLLSAKRLHIPKLMTAECSNNVAMRIISNVCKGRGFSIPLIIAPTDTHLDLDVKIVRPMKEQLAKEIAFYNHLNKLKTVNIPDITTGTPLKTTSIDRLVENFVNGLQAEYPSTVHTIVRTTEKLKTPKENILHCVICSDVLTARETKDLLEFVQTVPEEESTSITRSKFDFVKYCCYGCKRELSYKTNLMGVLDELVGMNFKMATEASTTSASTKEDVVPGFPHYVTENIKSVHKVTRGEMREQLKEFLLEEEESLEQ